MLAVIMSIAMVFDFSEKLEDFIEKEAPFDKILIDYYLNFVFYYSNLFSSLLIFLSVLFFTSKMAQRSEIIAILSSGVSFKRLLYPYFIAATVLVVISLYFTHIQLPKANQTRLQFEERYVRNHFNLDEKNIHREIEPGTLIYFENFGFANMSGSNFSMEKWSDDGELQFKLVSDRATYDTLTGEWTILNYMIRKYEDSGEEIRRGVKLDTLLQLKPSDLGQRLTFASQMSWTQLNDHIDKVRARGSDKAVFYEIEKHQRTSYPLATYILTLIGVSIASRKVRGGIGMHLALGVFIVFFYIFAMKVSTVAATNAGLNPLLAVWLPNIGFFIISMLLFRNAQK